MENERKHRKVEITKVHPRSKWTALRTKNQRLIFGYLVAKTNIKRKGIKYREDRREVLTDKEKRWNGIYVTNAELAQFLRGQTNINENSCRTAIQRTLQHLQNVKYIVIHAGEVLVNRHVATRAIEVLWDDKERCFISPLNPEKSNSSETSSETKIEFYRDTSETKMRSSETKTHENVTLENQTYGPTEPQNDQFSGAYNNNIIINTKNFEKSATEIVVGNSSSPQTDVTMLSSKSMIEGKTTIDHSDLEERFRYQMPAHSQFGKPAPWLSYWDTPGIGDNRIIRSHTLNMIRHVREKYNFDMAPIFTAENYRRLIHPELRLDIPLEFPEALEYDLQRNFYFDIEHFEKYFNGTPFNKIDDMWNRCVAYVRHAPRGISWHYDSTAYWHPPVVPVALDYSSYTRSPATTESPFHRDASLSQLEMIVNYSNNDTILFNYALRRQVFWLCGTTAMTPESLEYLLPKFKYALVENTKAPEYKRYQACIAKGSFGKVNLINWFKDFALRYHYFDWYADRVRNGSGKYFLDYVGAECDSSGAATGVIAYMPTQWGPVREMFFTHPQYKIFEKMRPTWATNTKIGQS